MMKTTRTRRSIDLILTALLGSLLLASDGCGSRNTPILIEFSGDVDDAESLQITPWLNGVQGQVIQHDPHQTMRVLWISDGADGVLRLQADATSSKSTACNFSRATAEVDFVTDSTHPVLARLEFPPAQCWLTVELPGVESVTSSPVGLDCQGPTKCTAGFSRGQLVTLTMDSHRSNRYSTWSGPCQAQGATCQWIAQSVSRVKLRDSRGICSNNDWCWKKPLPQFQSLHQVWGTDALNVWAVGDSGTLLRLGQTDGATLASDLGDLHPGGEPFYGIWGSDSSNVWAVGGGGTILKSDGGIWMLQSTTSSDSLYGVWGTNASNIWAVGDKGAILAWDGKKWLPQRSGTAELLLGVWGSDASNVWAVGRSGTILNWNGTAWSAQVSTTSEWLSGIWGSDASNVWAVGYQGTILKWDGKSWSAQVSGTSEWLRGVWGSDASNVWAVGGNGTILKWDGKTWARQSSGNAEMLHGVWGSNASNVWAVGNGGTILRFQP